MIGGHQSKVIDPALGGVGDGAYLGRVDRGLHVDLGDAGLQRAQFFEHAVAATGAPIVIEMIGEDDAFARGEIAEWEAGLFFGDRRW